MKIHSLYFNKLKKQFSTIILIAIFVAVSGCDKAIQTSKQVSVGDTIPTLTFKDIDGRAVNLEQELVNGPAVLIYYRGGWCPYCNTQLSELRKIESEIQNKGFQLYAISPDSPKFLRESVSKNDIAYTLLSDSDMRGARALGIAYKVDDDTLKKLHGYGIDIEKSSGGKTHHMLPHPAVIVVGQDTIVDYVYVNKDYTVRLSNNELLDALDSNTE